MEVTATSRIANRLLDRRWVHFAVELVLLVAGILIALAINGWSSERESRRSEQVYLELLARDLGQIESQLQQQIDFETTIINTAVAAYALIMEAEPAEHSSQIGRMLGALSSRRTLSLDSAAYTDLVSTGNLVLITDRDLRDRIIRYFSDTERRELIVEKNNRVFVDGIFLAFLPAHGVSRHVWIDGPVETRMGLNADSINAAFSPAMREPQDPVLSLPKAAPEWTRLAQQLSWRTMVAVIQKEQSLSLMASTVQLRTDLEARLAQ